MKQLFYPIACSEESRAEIKQLFNDLKFKMNDAKNDHIVIEALKKYGENIGVGRPVRHKCNYCGNIVVVR